MFSDICPKNILKSILIVMRNSHLFSFDIGSSVQWFTLGKWDRKRWENVIFWISISREAQISENSLFDFYK